MFRRQKNRAGIENLAGLMALSERELYMLPGIGKLYLQAIEDPRVLCLLPETYSNA